MMNIRKIVRRSAVCLVVAGFGCGDLLDVSDPSAFTDSDLDQALPAVARGVEGALHAQADNHVIIDGLISDVWKHTGTWSGYDDIDHGLIDYNNDGSAEGGSGLLSARFAAQDATRRFDRLEGEGQTIDTELRAQVLVSEAWVDLMLAEYYCESVGDPTVDATGAIVEYGQSLTDTQLWAQARDKLQASLGVAAGTDFAIWAQAGIARAELMLGNLSAANTAAGNVIATAPAGWTKNALYQISTLENAIVNLNTIGFNNAAGMREKWWPLVDDAAELMADPWSLDNLALTELDPRIPIRHVPGVLGVDGTTDYHSQWRYQDVGADIPLIDLNEMVLIQAEVAMRNDDFATARTLLNGLRTAAGLSPAPDAMADDRAEVEELLLNERLAEMFMEGHRQNDLVRFNRVPALMTAGDFIETRPTRAIKFPMSSAEAQDNPNVEDDASARCLPTASAAAN